MTEERFYQLWCSFGVSFWVGTVIAIFLGIFGFSNFDIFIGFSIGMASSFIGSLVFGYWAEEPKSQLPDKTLYGESQQTNPQTEEQIEQPKSEQPKSKYRSLDDEWET